MRSLFAALAAAALLSGAGLAAPHHCSAAAIEQAGKLLKFHWDTPDNKLADEPGPPSADGSDMAWDIDKEAKLLPPVKAPGTSEEYDVLEVFAYVYKATFRTHLIYLQIPDDCVLVGQEIIGQ